MLRTMSLALIVGPPNSGRAGEIRARLEAALDLDPVLVVPTLDDADRFERELCTRDGSRDSAVVGASIRTFRAFGEEIAAATGSELRPQLSGAQRLALVRAAVRQTQLEAFRGSAARRGFAPALERLISELQSSLLTPGALASAAAELEDGAYESELARLYEAYVSMGATRPAATMPIPPFARSRSACASDRGAWGSRPVLLYGFDDLTEEQLELVAALTGACQVTVAVNYEDREALAPRAALLARLRDELGGVEESKLAFDDTLHGERHPAPPRPAPVRGRRHPRRARRWDRDARMRRRARRGRGGRRRGRPAARRPGSRRTTSRWSCGIPTGGGPCSRVSSRDSGSRSRSRHRCLSLEPPPAAASCALARASLPEGSGEELLAFMRARPGEPQGIGDWVERSLLRGEAQHRGRADRRLEGAPVDARRASRRPLRRRVAACPGSRRPRARRGGTRWPRAR